MARYEGPHTVFYTDKEYGTQGHIGGVFGTYHGAETRAQELFGNGTALATWIEKRAPTTEEMAHDAEVDARRASAAAQHQIERALDAMQHLYLMDNGSLRDTQRRLLAANIRDAAQDMILAYDNIIDAKMKKMKGEKTA